LVDKYKNLIYSIPIKWGIPPDGAGDIFQQVCAGLVAELPNLRESKSLPAWLVKVTAHKCFHWSHQEQRFYPIQAEQAEELLAQATNAPDRLLLETEREQMLREALSQIPSRCSELIRMLFFEYPAVPYEEVAKTLRLSKGSIGFIRMRCLARLRRVLEQKGFR
jgi:RNA polymerase sigma factor (sigma-70 family)